MGRDSHAPELQFSPMSDPAPAAATTSHHEIDFLNKHASYYLSQGVRVPSLYCPHPEVITATHFLLAFQIASLALFPTHFSSLFWYVFVFHGLTSSQVPS